MWNRFRRNRTSDSTPNTPKIASVILPEADAPTPLANKWRGRETLLPSRNSAATVTPSPGRHDRSSTRQSSSSGYASEGGDYASSSRHRDERQRSGLTRTGSRPPVVVAPAPQKAAPSRGWGRTPEPIMRWGLGAPSPTPTPLSQSSSSTLYTPTPRPRTHSATSTSVDNSPLQSREHRHRTRSSRTSQGPPPVIPPPSAPPLISRTVSSSRRSGSASTASSDTLTSQPPSARPRSNSLKSCLKPARSTPIPEKATPAHIRKDLSPVPIEIPDLHDVKYIKKPYGKPIKQIEVAIVQELGWHFHPPITFDIRNDVLPAKNARHCFPTLHRMSERQLHERVAEPNEQLNELIIECFTWQSSNHFTRIPWNVSVTRAAGIRYLDLFEQLFNTFNKPLNREERQVFVMDRDCNAAFHKRCQDGPYISEAEHKLGMRRVDTLKGAHFFDGLKFDHDRQTWVLRLSPKERFRSLGINLPAFLI